MSEELKTIATTYEVFEAEFLRNHLENEGFEVYLADDNIVGTFNLLAPAIGGIKIRVPEDQADEAQEFVEKLRSAEIIYEDENIEE